MLRGASPDWPLVCLPTPACMHVHEACRLQFCDVWPVIFDSTEIPGLLGTAPLFGTGVFARWKRCFADIIGTPFVLIFPIHKVTVRALLLWRPTLCGAYCDRPLVCLTTLVCILRRLVLLLRLYGNPLPTWHSHRDLTLQTAKTMALTAVTIPRWPVPRTHDVISLLNTGDGPPRWV